MLMPLFLISLGHQQSYSGEKKIVRMIIEQQDLQNISIYYYHAVMLHSNREYKNGPTVLMETNLWWGNWSISNIQTL